MITARMITVGQQAMQENYSRKCEQRLDRERANREGKGAEEDFWIDEDRAREKRQGKAGLMGPGVAPC